MTKHYVGTKIIQAYPLGREDKPGYGVQYPDGYSSWSPKDVFEEAYVEIGVIPAGTPDFVQRLVGERAQLFDRYNKLLAFSVATKHNEEHEGHQQLEGDELSDIEDQLEAMRTYMHVLDQRIHRHGFIFHDTGVLFTLKQAEAESHVRTEWVIAHIIAKCEKAGVLLDIAASNTLPSEIAADIQRIFGVNSKVSCRFEKDYWTIDVELLEPYQKLEHRFVFRYLECYHRVVAKDIGERLDRAFCTVLKAGNAPNDVVFMSYLTDNFDKLVSGNLNVSAKVDGRRINGDWILHVPYSDDLLKGETFHYKFSRWNNAWSFTSENSRQDRFKRALDALMLFPLSVVTAIYNKLDESSASVYEHGPTLHSEQRGARLVFKDEALERLRQMLAAAAERIGEVKA
ncbi:hypothetical protein Xoosp14_45 [Xanthomonas phage Xoo-sp14]|nr:hypothetical protein Xoosp14_45 [Xanthomonas phage Xoo-sp14]